MGRKNKRINKGPDSSFEKFMKTFPTEQKNNNLFQYTQHTMNHQRNNNIINKHDSNFDDIKERNKQRLEYAKQQLELNNIEYNIINEEKTFMECRKGNSNSWIKYYASSGYIMGYYDFRGIKALIRLLKSE